MSGCRLGSPEVSSLYWLMRHVTRMDGPGLYWLYPGAVPLWVLFQRGLRERASVSPGEESR